MVDVKTTIELSEQLLRRARQRAVSDGSTLRSVFEQALQRYLDDLEGRPAGSRLRDVRFDGGTGAGLRPGVDLSDWGTVRDAIEAERWPSA